MEQAIRLCRKLALQPSLRQFPSFKGEGLEAVLLLEAGGQKGPSFIKIALNKLPFFSNRPIAGFACAPPHLPKRCMLGSQWRI